MKIKKMVITGFVVLAVVFSYSMQAVAKDSENLKVNVCHMDSKSADTGKVISVSASAVKAHIKHGDPEQFITNEDGTCKEYVKPIRPAEFM